MDIKLSCQCKSLQGVIRGPFRTSRNRTICMCIDCQSFARFLGKGSEFLDENGGTEIIPSYPAHIEFTKGKEHLKCLRLSPKGLFRFYAGCCKTPIANSVSVKLPFAGVIHSCIEYPDKDGREKELGPVYARIFGKHGRGKLPPGSHQKTPLSMFLTVGPFLVKGFLQGKAKPNPFFDEMSGECRVPPYILTKVEREQAKLPS